MAALRWDNPIDGREVKEFQKVTARQVNEKIGILKDFCVVKKNNRDAVKELLSKAKSQIELDKITRQLIDMKLHYTG